MILGQINIRSLNQKRNELLDLMKRRNVDIVCVQETWIKDTNYEFSKQHPILLENRADGFGGVAIIAKKTTIKKLVLPKLSMIEIIGAEVKINNNTYNIINFYVNPKAVTNNLISELNTITTQISNLTNIIMCGDANAAHPIWDNNCQKITKRADTIKDFLEDNSLMTLNTGSPTHLSYSKSRAIDITATKINIFNELNWTITDDNCGSDHLMILIKREEQDRTITYKDITNYKLAIKKLNEYNNDEINKITSLQQANKLFQDTLSMNTRKMKINKNKTKPWWTSEIQDQLKKRKEHLKRYIANMTYSNYIEHKRSNAIFRNMVFIA